MKFKNIFRILIVVTILALFNNILFAQGILDLADTPEETTSEPVKEKKYDFTFHGYTKLWGILKKFDNFEYGDVDQGKINARIQLKFQGNLSRWGKILSTMNFDLKFDAKNYWEDDYKKLTGYRVVETYFDWYAASWLSFRIGRQFVIWGEIEGIEAPTDIITPMNFDTETLEFEDSRVAPDVIAINFHYLNNHKIELLWIPVFTPSPIPPEEIERKRDVEFMANPVPVNLNPPAKTIENGEYAIRFSGTIKDFFKYGIAFFYGFDDIPDGKVYYDKPASTPINTYVDLINRRMMIPTVDLAFDIKDKVTIKACTAAYITEDHEGKIDMYKNSYVKYLFGVESANIFWNIYFSLYVGQMWVINYTEQHLGFTALNNGIKVPNELPNRDMLVGYDQYYKYRYMISNTIQRSFLRGNSLELIFTYVLYPNPNWDDIDFVVNGSISYKIISGLSVKLGGVFSNKVEVIRHYGILGLKYVF